MKGKDEAYKYSRKTREKVSENPKNRENGQLGKWGLTQWGDSEWIGWRFPEGSPLRIIWVVSGYYLYYAYLEVMGLYF